jgi:hypothetical protein
MEIENQADESQVTDSTQADESQVTETNTKIESKATATEEVKGEAAISQAEWQKAQEQIKALKDAQDNEALTKFETVYPIVQNDKYNDRWSELKKLKQTPGHRYSGLDYKELLNLMRDPSDLVEQPKAKKPTVPHVRVGGGASVEGETSPEVMDMLRQRYSDNEIKSVVKG